MKPAIRPAAFFGLKILVGLLIISPLFFALSYSFMSLSEISMIPPRIFPHNPALSNYHRVVTAFPVFRFLANSIITCAVIIVFQFITCGLGAYAFAFYEFRGKKIIFYAILSTFMIPGDAIIIANFLTISRIHLNNTYTGLVVPYISSAMGIFLMRQFFLTIPLDIHEAAVIDGCGDLRFLFSIVMPLSKPALAALGVYTFINVYNQYLWPLLVTNSDRMRTVQVGIGFLRTEETVNYGVVLAGAILVLIPAIVVFISGHEHLVKGMTEGAVKG
ncbi:MAG: carbohydrate ABC transporter permease [Treponema sp.]|nr:carbohydrate ABC transporter permease [Treponema sp.]